MQTTSSPHVILIASPGAGHLIPVLELGNRLAVHHGFDITVFVVAADSSVSESPLFDCFANTPATKKPLNVVLLPPVDISGMLAPTASVVTQIAAMMRAAVPSLRAAISTMSAPPTALVVDIFGTEMMVLADEFNILKYVFVTSTAWFLAVTIHLPSISEKERHEHRDLRKQLNIPGCRPLRFEDTLELFLLDHVDPDLYPEFRRIGVEIPKADGVLVNTWQELELSTLNELNGNDLLRRITRTPLYPIGPLVRPVRELSLGSEVLAWLDKQPQESVIYVSFGSGGTVSAKQTIELAWGLELCQHRFVWVIRPPADGDASAAFFNPSGIQDGTPDYLPEGFFTRTRDVGLVVPMWAPQAEVLAHKSVGGFLSHCGWNSTLESITNGVPIIAWPLYAEQKMNATMLKEEIGMAARLGPLEAGEVVDRIEIRDTLMAVMGGGGSGKRSESIKVRAREVREKAKEALRKGGSSYDSLSQVAKQCEFKQQRLSQTARGA